MGSVDCLRTVDLELINQHSLSKRVISAVLTGRTLKTDFGKF